MSGNKDLWMGGGENDSSSTQVLTHKPTDAVLEAVAAYAGALPVRLVRAKVLPVCFYDVTSISSLLVPDLGCSGCCCCCCCCTDLLL
jgi:hypothetical protein